MEEPTSYQLAILQALQTKPMYLGTVDSRTVTRRRAKNKAARMARRARRSRA